MMTLNVSRPTTYKDVNLKKSIFKKEIALEAEALYTIKING